MTEAAATPASRALEPAPARFGPRELLAFISATMALMALAIDLMLPAFDDIRSDFGLDPDSGEAASVITVFFLGLAVAQVFYGPLADRFGRKPILYSGIVVYIAGAIGSALAPSFEWLLIARFVWGIGAAGSRVVAVAIVRDRFVGNQMARAMSQIMAIFLLVPVFAPLVGASIIAVAPWRAVFWFCVVWAVAIVWWSRRLPETLAPEDRRTLQLGSVLGGMGLVVRNRLAVGYTLAAVFLQAVFTAYLGSSELLISDILGRGDQFPIVFGGVAVFFGIAALLNGRMVGVFGMHRVMAVAIRAYALCAFALLGVTLLAGGNPRFWAFMPILAVFLSLTMFLMPNLNTAALEPLGEVAGTASSLTGAARMAGGAVLAMIVDGWMDASSATPFAVGLAAFACGAAAFTIDTARHEPLRSERRGRALRRG